MQKISDGNQVYTCVFGNQVFKFSSFQGFGIASEVELADASCWFVDSTLCSQKGSMNYTE